MLEAPPVARVAMADRWLDLMMIRLAGEDHVGLGSDFDGAPMPQGLETAARLPNLFDAMAAAGFGTALIEKIASRNWLAFLRRALG